MLAARKLVFALAPMLLGAYVIGVGCVGEDPAPAGRPDASSSSSSSGGSSGGGSSSSGSSSGGSSSGGSGDAGTCDLSRPFGPATILSVPPTGSATDVTLGHLSSDEKRLYFTRGELLYVATKATAPGFVFDAPTPIAELNAVAGTFRCCMSLTADETKVYFTINGVADGPRNVLFAQRSNTLVPFGVPTAVAAINTDTAGETSPFVKSDGSEVYFVSNRGDAGYDLYLAPVDDAGVGSPAPLPNVGSAADEGAPVLSPDGRTLYFSSNRSAPGAKGGADIWVATRGGATGPFGPPSLVSEVNSTNDELPDWVSPDGCRLYFTTITGSASFMSVASRPPAP